MSAKKEMQLPGILPTFVSEMGNTINHQHFKSIFLISHSIFSGETIYTEIALHSAFLLTKPFTKLLTLAQFSDAPGGQ